MCGLAARLEIGSSHLTHIDKGQKGCSLRLAARIERETRFGVTMADLVKLQEGKSE